MEYSAWGECLLSVLPTKYYSVDQIKKEGDELGMWHLLGGEKGIQVSGGER